MFWATIINKLLKSSACTKQFDAMTSRVVSVCCLLAVDQHGAVSVMRDVIAHASHNGASERTQTTCADDHVIDTLFLAHFADELSWLLEVR